MVSLYAVVTAQVYFTAQVYLAVGLAIFAAGIPIAQAISQLDGLFSRILFIGSVVVEVLAVIACAVAVTFFTQVPAEPVPSVIEYIAGFGFAVVLSGSAGIILSKALSIRWVAALLSATIGIAILIGAIVIAQNVGGLVGKQIDVATGPRAIDSNRLGIWVAHAEGLVTQIDPESNSPVGREIKIPLKPGAELFHIAAGLGAVWVIDTEGWLYRIDPESREISPKIARVGSEAGEITVAFGHLWVNSYSRGSIVRIDPATYKKRVINAKADTAADTAYGHGWIWVTNDYSHQLTLLDPRTGEIIDIVPLPGDPNDIAYGNGLIFATYYFDQKLVAIDPATRAIRWTVRVGRQPSGIAILGNKAWVSNYAGDTLTRINITTGEVDATLHSAAGPTDATDGFGSVWIADFDAHVITRIASP